MAPCPLSRTANTCAKGSSTGAPLRPTGLAATCGGAPVGVPATRPAPLHPNAHRWSKGRWALVEQAEDSGRMINKEGVRELDTLAVQTAEVEEQEGK